MLASLSVSSGGLYGHFGGGVSLSGGTFVSSVSVALESISIFALASAVSYNVASLELGSSWPLLRSRMICSLGQAMRVSGGRTNPS